MDTLYIVAFIVACIMMIVGACFLWSAYRTRLEAAQCLYEAREMQQGVEEFHKESIKLRQEAIEYWKKINTLVDAAAANKM